MIPHWENHDAVIDHYERDVPADDAWLAALEQAPADVSDEQRTAMLSALDQFHLGGLPATIELARRAGIKAGQDVLDAGSGLGGPARYLAKALGAHVCGVDLSPRFVEIATRLTEAQGLSSTVDFKVADLLNMPFEDETFDVIWTQHVVMNIADRASLYREFHSLLKRGGTLAFYDPIATDRRPAVFYPTPWATSADESSLLTAAETRDVLAAAGFVDLEMEDVTAQAVGWLGQQQTAVAGSPVSLATVIGPRLPELVGNFGRSLREGRARVVMGVCRRS